MLSALLVYLTLCQLQEKAFRQKLPDVGWEMFNVSADYLLEG